jgi:hypothetical protein
MPSIDIIWDLDDDPDGNVQHIAEHSLTKDDARWWVLENPVEKEVSRSSGRPLVKGYTAADVYIVVVYEEVDEQTVYPVTASEIEVYEFPSWPTTVATCRGA